MMKKWITALMLVTQLAMAQGIEQRPESGMWYDPSRDGAGLDIRFYDSSTMGVVWYTYEPSGKPVWYTATGEYSDGRFSAALLRYRHDGTAAVPEWVGDIELIFDSRKSASMNWVIEYAAGIMAGSQQIILLLADPSVPEVNREGHWFDAEEPGWGLTVGSHGELEFAVLYFHDDSGEPTWALGAGRADDAGYAMLSFRGSCPGCEYRPSEKHEVGVFERYFLSERSAVVSLDIELQNGLSGRFSRNEVTVELLSLPVSSQDVAARRALSAATILRLQESVQEVFKWVMATALGSGREGCAERSYDAMGREIWDWGPGCIGDEGIEHAGKLVIDSELSYTGERVEGGMELQWLDYREDTRPVMNGKVEATLDLVPKSGSRYGGELVLSIDLNHRGHRMTGFLRAGLEDYRIIPSWTTRDTFTRLGVYLEMLHAEDAMLGGFVLEPRSTAKLDRQELRLNMSALTSIGDFYTELNVTRIGTLSIYRSIEEVEGQTHLFDNLYLDPTTCTAIPESGKVSLLEDRRQYVARFGYCTYEGMDLRPY